MFRMDGSHVRDVELPGVGSAGGFGGRQRRHRDVLHVHQHQHAAQHLPLRHDHRRKRIVAAGPGRRERRRLRGQTGLLREQGRHEGADVHRAQEGAEARRQAPDAALRLRRIQHLVHAPRFSITRLAWMEMGGVFAHGQPARWRRVRRGALARGRHETRRSRTCSTTSSPRANT